MSGDELAQLGLAVAVTLALIGVSALFGAWRSIRIDGPAARDRLAFDEPDFTIDDMMVGIDGRSAVAVDRGKGEGAVVFALGDSLATRRFRLGALGAAAESTRLRISLHDVSRREVDVLAPDVESAAEWARRMQAAPLERRDAVP
jgi:hypothetical protein